MDRPRFMEFRQIFIVVIFGATFVRNSAEQKFSPAWIDRRGTSAAGGGEQTALEWTLTAEGSPSLAMVVHSPGPAERSMVPAGEASAKVGRSRMRRKAIREDIYYWPDAKIPYRVDSSIDEISTAAKTKIEKAIAHWEQTTCVRFVPYNATLHRNALIFVRGQWCASKLGMAGGIQPLYLAAGCLQVGTIVHELGHSLGWVHEQTRPDRDEHVDIKWSIISPLYRPQYDKYSSSQVNTYDIPYDHSSIMHYPSYGELIARDSSKQNIMGQRDRLSFYDRKLANIMYKCAERSGCDVSSVECTADGYVGPDCRCVCSDGSSACTATNDVGLPVNDAPDVADDEDEAARTARIKDACEEWNRVENTFIVGHNDDVIFGVGVDECKAHCEKEKAFLCLSVNYWQERRHCYLSSVSKRTHRKAKLAHDKRILHYERNVCSPSASSNKPAVEGVGPRRTEALTTVVPTKKVRPSTTVLTPHKRNGVKCPVEYTAIRDACLRIVAGTQRPAQIAAHECKSRLQASIWNYTDAFSAAALDSFLPDGEYWVNVDGYRSGNSLADFFRFCPYLVKEKGVVLLKDNFCHRKKAYICSVEPVRQFHDERLIKKAYPPPPR